MKNEATIYIHHKRTLFAVLGKQSLFIEYRTTYTLLRARKYLQIDFFFSYEM